MHGIEAGITRETLDVVVIVVDAVIGHVVEEEVAEIISIPTRCTTEGETIRIGAEIEDHRLIAVDHVAETMTVAVEDGMIIDDAVTRIFGNDIREHGTVSTADPHNSNDDRRSSN